MAEGVVEKVLESFDQALARGVPAIKIVRGITRTYGIRRERVLEILNDGKRIRMHESNGSTILWSTCPAPAAARAMESQTRADLLQAGVDYAIAHGLIESDEIERTAPIRLFELVKTSLDGRVNPEREAA